jgi:arginyl-tRNA synthetase
MSIALSTNLQKSIARVLKQEFPAVYQSIQSPLLEIPKDISHGDLATNVALRLSRQLKQPPLAIAEKIKERLEANISTGSLKDQIKRMEIKPPGFINFFFSECAFRGGAVDCKRKK